MIENKEIIFSIVKASLWSMDCGELVISDDIMDELRKQSIDGLAAAVNPESINDKYLRASKFAQMLSVQSEVINCIQQANIPVVVIKGTAAGIYYPSPYLRKYGDIDILVHPDNYHKAIEVLKENGYVQDGLLGSDVTAFNKAKHSIELHQRPPGLSRAKEGIYIHSYLLEGIDQIEQASLEQPKMMFPMFPWKQNGLELIWHIRAHLYNGLGLRQIIDWMMFVSKCVSTTDKYNEFQVVLIQSGLSQLAIVVTRMCQIYLGLDKSITWCSNADDSLCEELMEYILDQGNFGKKREDDKAVKVMTKYRNPVSFLNALQKKGLCEWDLAKKHVVLQPIAWMYMGVKGIRMYIDKTGRERLAADISESKRRRELFDQLYEEDSNG